MIHQVRTRNFSSEKSLAGFNKVSSATSKEAVTRMLPTPRMA